MSKKTLSKAQIKELKKIRRLVPKFSCQGNLGEFFDNYLVCEATARKLVYYKTGKKSIILYIRSIESALKYYYPKNYTSIPINNIFASGQKTVRNNKTCRQLRNAYIHSLSLEDRNEIEQRIGSLKKDMQKWLDLF